jgi:hypothetical protein
VTWNYLNLRVRTYGTMMIRSQKKRIEWLHWWEKVDLNIPGTGPEFGDKEFDASSNSLQSMNGSDSDNVRKKKRYRKFNKKFDLKIPISFKVGDQFLDTHVFKQVLKTHAVQQRFDYLYKHNDTSRVSAIYKEEHCEWRIHAYIDVTQTCTQIKTYYPTYVCGNQYINTRCDVKYLVRTYKKDFKDDPMWISYALKERVKRDLNINVPIAHCYQAKREALHQLFGSHSKQYRLTRRYAMTIHSTNPGSSAYI